MDRIVRFCEANGLEEVSDLKEGMDFRLPQYRREVFMKFYEYHLKYRSHPGAVYYMIPYLIKRFNLTREQQYWLVFINGCTQNICTTWIVFQMFPNFEDITFEKFENWHREYWKRLDFDTDRRYIKGHLVELWQSYKDNLGKLTQVQFFEQGLCSTGNKYENFYNVWDKVMSDFHMFGRLSTFSYLEYLKIIGLNIDCPELFLEDLSGSKSHRNGLMKVTGRDDLDWFKDNELITTHSKEIVDFAIDEGFKLIAEAKQRFKGRDFFHDVNFFTLESTLCCYKSWHRVNRRYPNVYNDMFFQRIKKAESLGWEDHKINFEVFWEARKAILPKHLRIEDNKLDPTYKKGSLHSEKQNHYRLTGQVIMMDEEFDCFSNDFDKKYYA
jgi:hypothetical protein